MSRVEQVESQIQGMSLEELRQFREWFAQFDAERWERQMEEDARAGKLDALASQALRDHRNGLSTKL
jgi:hypothetical protein